MSAEIRILSTKKLQQHQKQFLLNAGIAVIESDFIETRYAKFELVDVKQSLIFTSQNAVKSVLENASANSLKNSDCFCVGIKTKLLLEKNGFKVLASAGYGSDLAKIIISEFNERSFTFFCGSIRRDELPDILQNAGIDFNEVEVYETILAPMKIPAFSDGILFFSPSAVESFLTENTIIGQTCFCIGATTASEVKNHLLGSDASNPDASVNIVIANQPTIESTIAKCINYYNKQIKSFKGEIIID